MSMLDKPQEQPQAQTAEHEVDAFFDGDCPVCAREVEWLRKNDRFQRIRFTNISRPDFDAERDAGMPVDRSHDCIQARLEDGEVLEGASVFRHLYGLVRPEGVPHLRRTSMLTPMVDLACRWLNKRRLRGARRLILDSCAGRNTH